MVYLRNVPEIISFLIILVVIFTILFFTLLNSLSAIHSLKIVNNLDSKSNDIILGEVKK